MKILKVFSMFALIITMVVPINAEEHHIEDVTIVEESDDSQPAENIMDKDDHVHNDDTNDSDDNETEVLETFEESEELEVPEVESEVNTIIKDPMFKKIVNQNLGYGFTEEHEPTKEELERLTDLVIQDKEVYNGHAYIEDISGLEYMTSLEDLRIIKSLVPEETFTIIGHMPKLTRFQFLNSYTSGNVSTTNVHGQIVNGQKLEEVPFDPSMNLGALGASNSIQFIEVSGSYLDYVNQYQHRVRGKLKLEGLGNLHSLKELIIGEFASVDDTEMTFVETL